MSASIPNMNRSQLFTLARDILAVADSSGRVLEVNPAAVKHLGWTQEELSRLSFFDLLHPDDHKLSVDVISRLDRDSNELQVKTRLLDKNGNYRLIDWSLTSSGGVDGIFYAVGRPVENEEETIVDRLLRSSPNAILKIERTGRIVFSNRGYENSNVLQFAAQESRALVAQALEKAFASPTWSEFDFVMRFPEDPESKWYRLRFAHLNTRERNEAVMIFTDISDRMETARVLSDSLQQIRELHQILDALHDHIIVAVTDQVGRITYANRKFEQISGYSREELLGQDHRILNSGTHGKEFFRDLWRTISKGKIWTGEICNRSKDGQTYWVKTLIVPVLGPKGEIDRFVSFRTDITEEKRAASMLLHNSKMSALGEMSGGIAHEINNPLAIISGKAQLLRGLIRRGILSSDELNRHIDDIVRTSERIGKITKGLLAFSREGNQDVLENVQLESIVNDTLALCQNRFSNHKIQLRFVPCENSPSIECRPVQVSQSILNILNNAFDAVHPSEDAWVEIALRDDDDHVQISITDSGPGIPAHTREKLMQPFFTTKPPGRGTGLGLSISNGLIASHGGTLMLDGDCPNTRFIIRLPKRQPGKQRSANEPGPT